MATSTSSERLNVKCNDAKNFTCMYVCLHWGIACLQEMETLRAPSHIPRCKLCVSLLRSAATKTHHSGQEISQSVTVERWCCWPAACIKSIAVRSCLIFKSVSVQLWWCHLSFHPRLDNYNLMLKFTYNVPYSGDINSCHGIVYLACTFRSPSEAKERASVFGAAVGSAGDPLVLQVQHFCGACPLCGAAPLELWHPPQWRRCHWVADCGTGRNAPNVQKY